MPRAVRRFILSGAMLLTTAVLVSAQQQATTTETKSFEVIAVAGNDLVVKLPEGTRELTVPEEFRFVVDGRQLSVHELKSGMKGTATITTKTTMHPVTVTEVKNGTVRHVQGSTMIVETEQGYKSFTQSEVDKRGVSIVRDGKPAQLSDFRPGDKLSATIVTTKPPRVVTEREVQATLAKAATAATSAPRAAARTAEAPAPAPRSTAPPRPAAPLASEPAADTSGAPARALPKTASPLPLVGVAGLASLAIALALAVRRRATR